MSFSRVWRGAAEGRALGSRPVDFVGWMMEVSFDTREGIKELELWGEIVRALSWEMGTPVVSASWLVARMGGCTGGSADGL